MRLFHSYPDPKENPQISTSIANSDKTLDKSRPEFALHEKFKIEHVFPGVATSTGIAKGAEPLTVSSKLANGLTVASQERHGLMSSFAIIVKTGSAYETQTGGADDNTGVTQFLELNGFRTTKNRDAMTLIAEVESLGGMVQCISTRESIIYCIDVLREHSEQALDILADTILNPLFPEEELEESRQIITFQKDQLPAEMFSRDALQVAAYEGSPLSNFHFCPEEKLEGVTKEKLLAFRDSYFFGGNCVISGAIAGMDHDEFVKLVSEKFGPMRSDSSTGAVSAVAENRGNMQSRKPSVYSGGLKQETRTLQEPFIKIAIAFEIGGWQDDMLVPTCVLQQLLGGGSSFSAGGPGKGMYTRLYTQVLNTQYWAESVEAFLSIHDDSGVFGIDGACPPHAVQSLMQTSIEQLCKLGVEDVSPVELNRAKNMLKSMMMTQLESRLVLCEDIARQFSTYGRRELPRVMCEKIEAVTAADLRKVGERMMQSPISISCVGHDLQHVPNIESINNFVNHYRANLIASKQQT
jgi:processing peptidase subunit alpha